MFRQYEDPWALEERLENAIAKLEDAKQQGYEADEIWYLYENVAELRERVNFAWQDQEYDEMYTEGF